MKNLPLEVKWFPRVRGKVVSQCFTFDGEFDAVQVTVSSPRLLSFSGGAVAWMEQDWGGLLATQQVTGETTEKGAVWFGLV